MNLFQAPKYNGYFKRGNTALPIVGVCTNSAYKRPLKEVQVTADMTAGTLVKVTNKTDQAQTASVNAGTGLAPTIFTAEPSTVGQTQNRVDGVLIDSPNFVLADGDAAPAARPGQIVYAALVGSGAEVYLPADDTIIGCDSANAVHISKEGVVNAKAEGKAFPVTIMSQVVKGIRFELESQTGKVKATNVNVVKVKL